MGISLNGLTPAGTYPGLIKTGDNTAISGTPKVLSDGLGNDLPMEVSTTGVNFTNNLTQGGTALQPVLVSGTNIKTINGASLLGSGNIPVVTSPSGVSGAIQFSDGSAFASDAAKFFWDNTNKRLGVGTNTPTATTHIRGVDQLQTSTSLLITDSIGTELLRVHNSANNSSVVMTTAKIASYEIISGNVLSNPSMRFVPTSTGLAINKDYSNPAASTLVHIKGSGSTSATTSLLVQNSAGANLITARDDKSVAVNASTQFCFGNAVANSNESIRILVPTGFGVSYIDGYSDGSAKFANYPIYFGSRVSNTGSATTGASTAENGTPCVFGSAVSDASAVVQVNSTTRGFLPPRMTNAQRSTISSPAVGLMVYCTDAVEGLYINKSTGWTLVI
jgi:hypothetical protein